MIYSPAFFNSPCALAEERAIFAEEKLRSIFIFPLLYNITFADLPEYTQQQIENRIYNEITTETGCIAPINQIVTKILLDNLGCIALEPTPCISHNTLSLSSDQYITTVLEEYLNISADNFNARISMLFCIYLYVRKNYSTVHIPEHLSRTIEYLTHYTRLDIPLNHKELIIAELTILSILQLL